MTKRIIAIVRRFDDGKYYGADWMHSDVAWLLARHREMAAALTFIAAQGGMTLLGPKSDREGERMHEIGAAKAFDQCADAARAALARAEEEA